jgi:hypothetical protein
VALLDVTLEKLQAAKAAGAKSNIAISAEPAISVRTAAARHRDAKPDEPPMRPTSSARRFAIARVPALSIVAPCLLHCPRLACLSVAQPRAQAAPTRFHNRRYGRPRCATKT